MPWSNQNGGGGGPWGGGGGNNRDPGARGRTGRAVAAAMAARRISRKSSAGARIS